MIFFFDDFLGDNDETNENIHNDQLIEKEIKWI